MIARGPICGEVDDFPGWGIPKVVSVGRGVPEMNAQEGRLGSMNKRIQGMLCGVFKEFFFDDEHLV